MGVPCKATALGKPSGPGERQMLIRAWNHLGAHNPGEAVDTADQAYMEVENSYGIETQTGEVVHLRTREASLLASQLATIKKLGMSLRSLHLNFELTFDQR